MNKIGILVGSLRKESYNRKIANYIISKHSNIADYEIIEIMDLPLYNEDLEGNEPESVLAASELAKEKDAFIIVTPEYNHAIPGGLKNALDWFSRGIRPFARKPFLVMGGSSGGVGTARAQEQIRQVFNGPAFQMYSISFNELLFPFVQNSIDEEGNITDEESIKLLEMKLIQLNDFISMLKTNNI